MADPFRIGHGYDIHKLKPGGVLMLAGVQVSDEMSAIAHSDGDIVIHAIVDALLGAMAWGDIGQHFDDSDPKWKGTASRVFLQTIYHRVTESGFRLQNLDVTIMAEKPKLAQHRAKMREELADLMVVPADRINLKAGTNEGCGEIGAGLAIAAHAVVLLTSQLPLESPPA